MLSLALLILTAAGVVLPILAAAVAASRGASEPAVPVPTPLGAAIPLSALGLTWRRLRDVRTGRGPRVLWLGEGDSTRYSRAFRLAKAPLYDAGYSWGTVERSGGAVQPVCWEDPAQGDAVAVDAIAAAEASLAEDDRRLALEEQRRRQAEALDAELNGDARRGDLEALRQSLRLKAWAWSKRKREVAEALLREPDGANGAPKAATAKLARDLVAEVEAAIEAVRVRVAKDPARDWLARAEDPDVRMAVHYAVKLLTDMDRDMASLDNGVGWGRSHTHAGHVLASLPELSVIEATNALAAVWRHRKQLRPEVRARVFGSEQA
ncbi:hypothetical protein [Methylobacterium platani]|uniref:Uncharacterized protein n=2 Tax=Methylobacterium platani TaxID=427683 RepID=A0A179SAP3_9HYPH|nr:hypothetical protein [Methylobacterium platani]KMO16023.1 hypothetical protein SQ03_15755 [Methylobacterium platani JCM 14648]OAS24841.1 hypothetical protein A5481_12155 [Methylobacterium platani]